MDEGEERDQTSTWEKRKGDRQRIRLRHEFTLGGRFLGVVLLFSGLFGMFEIFKKMKSHMQEKSFLMNKGRETGTSLT